MYSKQYSFLELKVVWKDDEMLELMVYGSNSRYSGKTEVYVTSETLLSFTKSLLNYPKEEKQLFYQAGERDSYAYFSMRYYVIGFTRLIGVEIELEENVATEFRPEEKSKLKLEIIVEPSAIDKFQKELTTLAKNQDGKATLYGTAN